MKRQFIELKNQLELKLIILVDLFMMKIEKIIFAKDVNTLRRIKLNLVETQNTGNSSTDSDNLLLYYEFI